MIKIIRAATVPMSLDAFCNGMLKELSEKYEVVALSSPGPEFSFIEERERVRTIKVPMERHISIVKDLKALTKMVGVFRKEKPTMVHSMTPKAGLLCMIAGWLTRVPVRVHTFTGLVFPTSTGLKRRILMFTDFYSAIHLFNRSYYIILCYKSKLLVITLLNTIKRTYLQVLFIKSFKSLNRLFNLSRIDLGC